VDWSYLHEHEPSALQREIGWLKRQAVRIVVDLSSGVNLYPTLRLVDNVPDDYTASMAAIKDVLSKMELLGASDLIFSLHRHPENNFTDDQTRTAFTATLKTLAGEAAKRGVTLQLRVGPAKPPWSVAEGLDWISRVSAPNLKLAVSTVFLEQQPPSGEAAARLKDRLGLWLLAASRKDAAGKTWDTHAPLHSRRSPQDLARSLGLSPAAPIVLDALYANQDEEYLDAAALAQALGRPAPTANR
jgi:hypothetical protein